MRDMGPPHHPAESAFETGGSNIQFAINPGRWAGSSRSR
jgi:hypothetical protein